MLTTTSLSCISRLSALSSGIAMRQGPQPLPQKSISTHFPRKAEIRTVFPSLSTYA